MGMSYLEKLAKIRNEKLSILGGICKGKDLKREITFRWYGIGNVWTLDEIDTGLIGIN